MDSIIRAPVGRMRMQEPWKTDKWFVSPWCYLPEVRKSDRFVPNIEIHDVTLSDGEKQTAVVFRRDERVAIAGQHVPHAVHGLGAGMPAVAGRDPGTNRAETGLRW